MLILDLLRAGRLVLGQPDVGATDATSLLLTLQIPDQLMMELLV